MTFVISPVPCQACGLEFSPLLAIKCPHCGEIQDFDMNQALIDLNEKLGWKIR